MRLLLTIIFPLILMACASPAFNMTNAQIYNLSDDQLCAYRNNYRSEARTEAEVARRRLNCNPHYRECLARGNQPGSEAMGFCVATLRENQRLRYEANRHQWDVFRHHDRHYRR